MITQKDAKIISHLRNNARKKITNISTDLNIPATTIYDKLRVHEKKFINKHTTLLNFQNLGLHAKAHLSIKVERNSKEDLQKFLLDSPNVNSLYKTNFGSDFLAEVVFKNTAQVDNLVENLEDYFKAQVQVFNVIEELKKESFLTDSAHFELMK